MSESTERCKYFHEDDYCQVEILPLENWGYCAKELGVIADFSEEHQAEGGFGWTQMYLRGDAQVSMASKKISFDAVVQSVSGRVSQYDSVATGYASHREDCPNVVAFGHEDGPTLFIEQSADAEVSGVWLDFGECNGPEEAAMYAALKELDSWGPFLLVDWARGHLVPLAEEASMMKVLREYTEFLQSQEPAQDLVEVSKETLPPQAQKPWWRFWS